MWGLYAKKLQNIDETKTYVNGEIGDIHGSKDLKL